MTYSFVTTKLGLIVKDVEPGIFIETCVIVSSLHCWGHVQTVTQGIQGRVPGVKVMVSSSGRLTFIGPRPEYPQTTVDKVASAFELIDCLFT